MARLTYHTNFTCVHVVSALISVPILSSQAESLDNRYSLSRAHALPIWRPVNHVRSTVHLIYGIYGITSETDQQINIRSPSGYLPLAILYTQINWYITGMNWDQTSKEQSHVRLNLFRVVYKQINRGCLNFLNFENSKVLPLVNIVPSKFSKCRPFRTRSI